MEASNKKTYNVVTNLQKKWNIIFYKPKEYQHESSNFIYK